MKILKMSLIISMVALLIFTAIPVSAATENDIIDFLKENDLSSSYITQAESFFKTADFTSEQLDTLKTKIESVMNTVKEANPEVLKDPSDLDLSKFTAEQKQKIIADIENAADTLDLTVNFVKDPSGVHVAEFIDSSNKKILVVSPLDTGLKITDGMGDNRYLLIAAGGLLILVAFVGSYVARKFIIVK